MGDDRHRYRQLLIVALFATGSTASFGEEVLVTGIEEIVVTASKRDEKLQDAPLSISVITSKALLDNDIGDIYDVAGLVPSFGVAQSTGPLSSSYFIRRIGNLGSIPNFESAVGVIVDGAFRSRAGAAIGDLFDLRQVEIARGPQTTLHGKNTTAGLVSIATNPPHREFELQGKLTAGRVDAGSLANLVRLEGIFNTPLSPAMSFRAGGVVYRHDETLVNLFNGDNGQNADRYTVRGQLLHSGQGAWDARLVVNRFRVDSARLGDLVLFEGNAIAGINGGFGVPCPPHAITDRLFCRNDASRFDLTSSDVTLNVDGKLGELSIQSISSFEDYGSRRDFDADQLNIDVVRVVDRQRGSGFSQEFRLASSRDAPLTWLAGAFYLDSEFRRGDIARPTAILGPDAPNLELVPGVPVGNAGDQGYFDSDSATRHLSVFGSVDWALSDTFSVRAGLRWQTEDKRTAIVNSADHAGPSAITLQLMPAFANAMLSRDTSGVSWELAGRYRLNEAHMAYLQLARGFKSGGFNAGFGATLPPSREFDDETVNSLELGYKSVLRDGRMWFNAALFSARYRNFQSAGWVSLRFLVNNAERVDMHGIEFDFRAALTEYLGAGASLSWVDARYDRYANGSCSFDRLPDNVDGTACDLSGKTLPLAPRTQATLDLNYERPMHSGTFFGGVDWAWSGEYFTNSSLDGRHIQDDYALIDMRLGFRFERFEVSAWIRNAGDRLVVMREGPSNLFPRDPAYGRALAAPRTYGLTLSVRL